MPKDCTYTINNKTYTEREFKEYLLDNYDTFKDYVTNKTKPNAIQEPSASSVLQYPQEGVGEPRGEREGMEPGEQRHEAPKESKSTGEKEEIDIHAERPPTVLTHRGLQELATEAKLENVAPRERESRLEQLKKADDTINEWKEKGLYTKNINDVIERSKEGKINEVEQKVLANHIATLREQLHSIGKTEGIDSQKFKDKFDEIYEVKEAAQMMRSKAGGLLGDKVIGLPDDTLEGFLLQEKDLNKGAPLTGSQIKTAVNEYEKINSANEDFKKKYEDLQADYAKLLAERELKKQATSGKKAAIKKTHEDYVKDRKSLIEKLKQQKAEHEKSLEERGIQKQGFGITLTNDMVKTIKDIVASYVEEGAAKLEDVIKGVHGEIKEVFPSVTERDIADVIAGKYAKKLPPRTELAERMQNLKTQQTLIDKYDAMLKGEKPKTDKSQIKFNQEIHELREKIKGLEREEKEANRFYGESDKGNRRIEKLEDELQRLKERQPKTETPKERRELSEREKELKQQIYDERKAIRAEEKEANRFYKEDIDPQAKKLQQIKDRNQKEIQKIIDQLNSGEFAIPEKKKPLSQNDALKQAFPKAYKEALDSQTRLMKMQQARQLRMALQEFENLSEREKFAKNAVRYLNVPRTLMASMDFSAPLRQGIVATIAHPGLASKSFLTMFKHAWSQEAFDRFYHDVRESPRWQLYQDSKLSLTDPHELHLSKQEEAYLGGNVAEKIPLLGRGIKASERAYVSYLNKLRMDLFDRFADRLEADGKTYSNSPDLYKAVASFVNSSTGRGNMATMENAAPFLSSVLFAPRLIASRLNMIGLTDLPNLLVRGATLGKKGLDFGFYTKMPKEIRVAAMKDMLKLIGTGIAFLAAAKAGGASVEIDPRSSDFGKIRVGNTRWDIWGGFQPYIRLISQMVTGQSKSTNTGKIYDLSGEGAFGRDRGDVLESFMRGKLSPTVSLAYDLVKGRTVIGEKINRAGVDIPFIEDKWDAPEGELNLTDELKQHFVPLLFQDVYDAWKDKGVQALFTAGIPSTFGVGVSTYEPKQSNSKKHSLKPPAPPKPKVPQP